jgi:hypothetical protein
MGKNRLTHPICPASIVLWACWQQIQGDRMSLPKNRPKCRPTHFLSKLIQVLEKVAQNVCNFCHLKKLPKDNSRPNPKIGPIWSPWQQWRRLYRCSKAKKAQKLVDSCFTTLTPFSLKKYFSANAFISLFQHTNNAY